MSSLTLPVSERDHIQGSTNAVLTIVEYGDYECPFCGEAHTIVKEVLHRLGDKLCFVFRNFPLSKIHPHSRRAAEVAEAAAAQGKFWEMHDYLFDHQDALDDEHLWQYAAALGLDISRLDLEMSGGAHKSRIREDMLSGVRSGVNGTPTFFFEGVRYDGPMELESFLSAIKEKIAD